MTTFDFLPEEQDRDDQFAQDVQCADCRNVYEITDEGCPVCGSGRWVEDELVGAGS